MMENRDYNKKFLKWALGLKTTKKTKIELIEILEKRSTSEEIALLIKEWEEEHNVTEYKNNNVVGYYVNATSEKANRGLYMWYNCPSLGVKKAVKVALPKNMPYIKTYEDTTKHTYTPLKRNELNKLTFWMWMQSLTFTGEFLNIMANNYDSDKDPKILFEHPFLREHNSDTYYLLKNKLISIFSKYQVFDNGRFMREKEIQNFKIMLRKFKSIKGEGSYELEQMEQEKNTN